MPLMQPFPVLDKPTTNSSVGASAWGATATSGAANTMGTWVSLGTTPAWESYLLTVFLNTGNTAATNRTGYVDIGIGPNSSTVEVIVEKLGAGGASPMVNAGSTGAGAGGRFYYLPVRIPANTELWARYQCVAATQTISVHASFSGGANQQHPFPCASKIVAVGATTASSVGTTLTPGASGAEGSWAAITTSSSDDYVGVLVSHFCADTTTASPMYTYDIGIGAAAAEQVIGQNVTVANHNGNEQISSISIPVYAQIPAGSRISARASCSGTSDSSISAVIHGMLA